MTATTKPSSVFSLLLLVYIGAAFTFLIALEQFIAAAIIGDKTDQVAIKGELVDAGVAAGYAEQAQSMVLTLAIISFVAAVIHIILAIYISKRANWARIVLVILVGVGTLTDISWIIQGRWFVGTMLTIYDVAILVLALAPATAAFCRKKA
jgi:hypothetical protein